MNDKTIFQKFHRQYIRYREQRLLKKIGLPKDFELPYPYPRNEHEEGMNWVAVNSVGSSKANW
jgi:hypothetical protein